MEERQIARRGLPPRQGLKRQALRPGGPGTTEGLPATSVTSAVRTTTREPEARPYDWLVKAGWRLQYQNVRKDGGWKKVRRYLDPVKPWMRRSRWEAEQVEVARIREREARVRDVMDA